ncbi:MAG TPA: cytochrome b/b6 domain-containing protein [Ferruginibacter sp.]|nr:cytochrome b/b6 domain-containing protein [Ferruginibacter sp.]
MYVTLEDNVSGLGNCSHLNRILRKAMGVVRQTKAYIMEQVKYSKVYRIIHWAIAITFILLLFTVFLRMTWMNKENVAAIIQDYLGTTDQELSQDKLIVLAKKIRKPMWDWHIYLGYVLVGLFSIRFMLPVFGTMKFQNPFSRELTIKQRFQKSTYLVFYVCVLISLVTGLIIELGPKEFKKPMEEIHVLGIYYSVAFIGIHLAGVLLAEFTTAKGIISGIISGPKKES